MEMFLVFNIPPFCSQDSFASHLFRVFVHLNTIKKQELSRDLRSPSAIFIPEMRDTAITFVCLFVCLFVFMFVCL